MPALLLLFLVSSYLIGLITVKHWAENDMWCYYYIVSNASSGCCVKKDKSGLLSRHLPLSTQQCSHKAQGWRWPSSVGPAVRRHPPACTSWTHHSSLWSRCRESQPATWSPSYWRTGPGAQSLYCCMCWGSLWEEARTWSNSQGDGTALSIIASMASHDYRWAMLERSVGVL